MVTPLPLSLLPSVPDAISSTNPRVIDDARARKLSSDLKRCTYYETCATYGLNVERVFQDGERCRGDPGAASPRGGRGPRVPQATAGSGPPDVASSKHSPAPSSAGGVARARHVRVASLEGRAGRVAAPPARAPSGCCAVVGGRGVQARPFRRA